MVVSVYFHVSYAWYTRLREIISGERMNERVSEKERLEKACTLIGLGQGNVSRTHFVQSPQVVSKTIQEERLHKVPKVH